MYKAGDDITLPKLVYEVKPAYTREAKKAGLAERDLLTCESSACVLKAEG